MGQAESYLLPDTESRCHESAVFSPPGSENRVGKFLKSILRFHCLREVSDGVGVNHFLHFLKILLFEL